MIRQQAFVLRGAPFEVAFRAVLWYRAAMKFPMLLVSGCAIAFSAFADEGMWLFNAPPREILQTQHSFEVTDQWLEHLQKSSVRFNVGGSASFVSEEGLLITNHHIGHDALRKLSTAERDLVRDGYYAETREQELKCLDLELNVLQSIEDVTERVNAAVPKDAGAEAAFAARREVIAEIEKQSLNATGLRSDVVTLWQGGAYQLYRYKRYTDVRLVFAPLQQMAFFGGDPDNFEFPRYDLDICLFRAYEDGKPAKVDHYLHFSPTGPELGELVFVSGHPGHTSRLLTLAELKDIRDRALPARLNVLRRVEVLLANWSERSIENRRRAEQQLFGVRNARKALGGRLAGLLDPEQFGIKASAESSFKAQLAGKPEFSEALKAYDRISEATRTLATQAIRRDLLEGAQAFNCESFGLARALLRSAAERVKPNGERLREFSDANKVSFELALLSPRPIYEDLEILTLADSLTFLCSELGIEDPLVQKLLAGKSPGERAVELIQGTRVRDVSFRKRLYELGGQEVLESNDPMIELARLVDPVARAMRKVAEDQGEIKEQAHSAIARARNRLSREQRYPDATFTLRLAFGTVKGYQEEGHFVAPFTTFAGLYGKAEEMGNRPPYDLPPLWQTRRSQVDLETHLNFVSTCDIIGGNSGSPVVNRAGEFVGIIFDGNLQSLPWDYWFDDRQGRATAVDSAGILEALSNVYNCNKLVRELRHEGQ